MTRYVIKWPAAFLHTSPLPILANKIVRIICKFALSKYQLPLELKADSQQYTCFFIMHCVIIVSVSYVLSGT